MTHKLTICLLLWLGFGLTGMQLQAQNKMQKKATFYAEEAAKEFGLDDETKQRVYEVKLKQMKANKQITKRNKAGEFEDKEALKQARSEAMQPFLDEIRTLTGAKPKAFKRFNKRANQEMKEVK